MNSTKHPTCETCKYFKPESYTPDLGNCLKKQLRSPKKEDYCQEHTVLQAVFLDFDGIINSKESFKRIREKNKNLKEEFDEALNRDAPWEKTKLFVQQNFICPSLVGNMKVLFDELPNAHFIVSSGWGRRWSLSKIKDIFEPFLPVERLDITPKKFSSSKIHEIPFWLSDNFGHYPKWREDIKKGTCRVAIIDDVAYGFDFEKFFLIDDKVGLTMEKVREIISYLKNSPK